MRLLIVDDDAVFREELGELLRDEGHEVSVAPSAAKALEALDGGDHDLVFTDLKMPRQSGLELLREVKKRWPRILVVMITGYATVETAVEAMKEGAFDYIRKPFDLEQVHQVIAHVQEERRFRGEVDRPRAFDDTLKQLTGPEEREVLLFTHRALRANPRLTVAPAEMENPVHLRDQVEDFLLSHSKPAVVLEEADRLFTLHRRQDALDFLNDLRTRLDGRGPLVVSFDPKKISAVDARDLRAAVIAPNTRLTLETLSNPIRRAVLRRAAEGSCSFTEAMRAAGLDDSPKLSFHLRKLMEDGLVVHSSDVYRITPRGKEAVDLLTSMDTMAPVSQGGNTVLGVPGERP